MSERRVDVVERLIPGLPSEDDWPTVGSFLRGLAIGALVGAAIAGSTLWQRRRDRLRAEADATDASEASAVE